MADPVCVVTGANRGIGARVAVEMAKRGFTVAAASRSSFPVPEALGKRADAFLRYELDLASPQSIEEFSARVLNDLGGVDVLINNAGVYLDRASYDGLHSIADLEISLFRETLEVNLLGPTRLIQKFLPGMKERNYGRIVNVSSGMGRFFELDRRAPFYRVSKSAINTLTRVIADEVREYNVLVNAVCPGWVRTEMGGPDAVRSVEEGAAGIIWAALLPEDGPRGALLRDGENFGF